MKFFLTTAIVALAGLASAQQKCMAANEAIPACAAGFYRQAANSIGGCGLVDFKCQCAYSASIQGVIAQTVAQQCGGQIGDVLSGLSSACECASTRRGNIKPNLTVKRCSASSLAVPACAAGYIASAAYYSHGCDLDDFACQCSNSAPIQGAIANTVAQQCGGSLVDVLSSQSAFCACATGGGRPGGSVSATSTSSVRSVSAVTGSPSRFTSASAKATSGFHA